ncbi:MAG: GNAT family N-acetyltransferase, partial [Actinomycetes bacterium]
MLTDGVVTLRVHRPDDIDDMMAMGNDPETVRWTTAPVPYERSHAEQWVDLSSAVRIADAATYRWAIEADDNGTPRFAGNIDLRFESAPDIGYALAPWARGNGYMSRAVRLVTQWAFDTLGLTVVQWSTHVDNWASWKVAHACGFTFHGTIPQSHPQRGALRDGWFASLRPGDDPTTPRTTWLTAATLANDRVRLRPYADTDVPRIVEACSDERTRLWLRTMANPYTEESAITFIRSVRLDMSLGQRVVWAITAPDDDRLLGNV